MGIHGRFTRALSASDIKVKRQSDQSEEQYGGLERLKALVDAVLSEGSTGLSTVLKVYDAAGKFTATTLAAVLQEIATAIDGVTLGVRWRKARFATITALPSCTYANGTAGVGATLTADADLELTIDGVVPTVGDLVLVKNQAAPAQNGLYAVTAVGAVDAEFVLTRHTSADQAAELVGGNAFAIEAGNTLADTVWLCTTDGAVTIGTTAITFIAIPGTDIIVNGDFPANARRILLARNGDGETYSNVVYHSTNAGPTAANNTEGGLPNGSFWHDTDSGQLWFKGSEQGGDANWSKATSPEFAVTLANDTADADISGAAWDTAVYKAVKLQAMISMGTGARRVVDLIILLDSGTPGNSTVTAVDATSLGEVGVTFTLVDGGSGTRKLQATTTDTGASRTLKLSVKEQWT